MEKAEVERIVDERLAKALGKIERAIVGEPDSGNRGILARVRSLEVSNRWLFLIVIVGQGAVSWKTFLG